MSKFKNAMSTLGKVADRMIDRSQEIDKMTNELMRRGYGIELASAKKIATILIDQADVTWKR